MLDKILYKLTASTITTVSFITLFMKRYHNRLYPLVRLFFFVPDQLNKLMDGSNVSPPACKGSTGI
jgi:hypothetical protein